MGEEIVADGFGGGHEGLAHDLAPKQTLTAGHPVVRPSGEQRSNRKEIDIVWSH